MSSPPIEKTQAAPRSGRNRLWTAIKLGLTVLLLILLARRVDVGSVVQVLGAISTQGLVAAAVLTFAAIGVSAWRWLRVLRYLGKEAGFLALFGDVLVGSTYNLLLPTSVGGDVIRSIRCSARVGAADAWASVAFERIMGLFSLALVSWLGLWVTSFGSNRQLVLVAAAATGILLLALVAAPAPLRLLKRGLERWGLTKLAKAIAKIADAFSGPLRSSWARGETLLWSLAYQLVSLSILYVVVREWSLPQAAVAIYLAVPIALIISTAPVTIGGLGLREGLFVAILAPFGFGSERALALSLVWLCSSGLAAVAGVAIMLLIPNPKAEL